MSKSTYSIVCRWPRWISFVLATALFSVILISANTETVLPDDKDVAFSKAFISNTIGPGSTTTLLFTITSRSASPVVDLAFTDTLPAGVTIASPAGALTTCSNGILNAPDGGGTITFSGGRLLPYGSCTVTVNVTSSILGTHTNTSGDLTSSAGNHGSATADLNVVTNLPGFSKSFSPISIPPGGTSTLTFLIDNTASQVAAASLTFTDILPLGLVIADPANASTTCTGGTLIADSGTSTIILSNGYVAAASSCTVTVDVTASDFGEYHNVSSELTTTGGVSGFAAATLEVPHNPLIKSFTDDPVPPGGTVTLEFTITNFDRSDTATNIAFSDDLNAALSGLAATGLPANDVCGAGSQLVGTSVISLIGGTLPPGGSCTFSTTLQVPAAAASGTYTNTTTALAFNRGGTPITENTATDHLTVNTAPILTKRFDDPVGAGDAVTLTFTISNTSLVSSVTNIAFQDVFPVILPTAAFVPSSGFCGAGSTATFTPPNPSIPAQLVVSGANLAPGASCSFDLVLNVAPDAPNGVYPNITSDITGQIGGETVVGKPATDDLEIVAAPELRKSFIDDPVLPGDTVTLEFTLIHSPNAPGDATDISFTDGLTFLSGLAATGLPANDVCGTDSQISGTTNLSFTGGTLAPGASCTFSVTLQVPAGAPSGSYTNTTSNITATVSGLAVTGNQAQDALDIAGLSLTKEFTDDPVVPGDTVTLEFNLVNTSIVSATDITFNDDLGNVFSGLLPTDLPKNDICGPGSSLALVSGDTLHFQDGTLDPGASCTFTATLVVPAGTASDTYGNTTSNFQATIDGTTVSLANASDGLVVSDEWLWLTKEFTDDPVAPGGTVTLEFTIENLHATQSVTDIAFTDDLSATLSGLAAIGLPLNDVCGIGSQISGTNDLTFTGGELGPGASCTFSVTLQVPAGAPFGAYNNATSEITGTIGDFGVRGEPATDDLRIADLVLTKTFDDPAVAGGTVDLEFTIENLGMSATVDDISFSDDLDAVVPGLVAISLPPDGFCGAGSRLTGSSVLSMSGGILGPSASCTFSITLQVPASAAPGDYINTTSDLLSAGSSVGDPATDTLTIEPPPAFGKSFAPNPIAVGFISTLTFSIDNTTGSLAASGLDFTDNLPAGLLVANPANASTTCAGGTLTAVVGSGVIVYTGGTVAAGATCTIQVNVTSNTAGDYVNVSGDLTSSLGNSGTATDTLVVAYMDFGDAVDPTYPTLFASMGASHELGSDVFLGSCVDAESNGQPTTGADGDDVNASGVVFGTCQEGDDEDGVVFLDHLVVGRTVGIEVTANAACTLTGWVDFNADGDWTDAGEDLFPDGELLTSGVNSLTFMVPITAELGVSYARFRCTTDGAVAFAGPASDGEVEDYQVSVWTFVSLPLVMNDYVTAPDLVIERIIATENSIQVVIRNDGNVTVEESFWVDGYINPNPSPTQVNQSWPDVASQGLVWGVNADLEPGETLTLTVGGAYYKPAYSSVSWPLAVGTVVYAQVDSYNVGTTYGRVLENHEIRGEAYNNVSGPALIAADAAALPPLGVEPMVGDLRTLDSLRHRRREY